MGEDSAEKLSFVARLAEAVKDQSYGQLMFIMMVGLGVVLALIALTFLLTKNLKSPHDS